MFPNFEIGGKAEYKIYEYKYFLAASKKFPKFGTQGSHCYENRGCRIPWPHIQSGDYWRMGHRPGEDLHWGLYFQKRWM